MLLVGHGRWQQRVGGESDGYFDVSVNPILHGCQAAETAPFSGMLYLLLAYREIASERFPKETQQEASTPLEYHAGHVQRQHPI